jgi:hypothetical protein
MQAEQQAAVRHICVHICVGLLPCSISQAVHYPQMLLQLDRAGFNLGHVADMNYLTRPVSGHAVELRGSFLLRPD